MSEQTDIFDLNKIKNLTDSIYLIQSKLNVINSESNTFIKNNDDLKQSINDPEVLNHLEDLSQLFKKVNSNLKNYFESTLKGFQEFRDMLIHSYKKDLNNKLKNAKGIHSITRTLGLKYIKNKKVSKILRKHSIISSISRSQWLDIVDSLNQNSLFQSINKNFTSFYQSVIKKKIEKRLKTVPPDIQPDLIESFKEKLQNNFSLTFVEFIKSLDKQPKSIDLDLGKEQPFPREKEIKPESQERSPVEKPRDIYQEYLKLPKKEFERIKRRKSRPKLSELLNNESPSKEFKINKEVSEKIEKFKSKLDKSFQDKYLLQEPEKQDPLELIRKRKKEKKEEFQRFIDKIKKE
ncbi:MAG: hypothetical protein ACTSYC_11920 [Promethearchaeota archaeon]